MTVFFHGNFGLHLGRMSQIAKLASENPSMSDGELAKFFEYGAPFAATYRSWLHKAGIANLRRPFTLTEAGRIVIDFDPDFQSDVTKWFLHLELTTDPERAETWHFFACEFRKKYEDFSKEDLRRELMMKLRGAQREALRSRKQNEPYNSTQNS